MRKKIFLLSCRKKIAIELTRCLHDVRNINISIGDNQILFEAGEIQIISRLIEGNFPEYKSIIPKQFEVTCFIKKDVFLQAVRSASIFSSKIQEVTLKFENKNLFITSLNQEIGENKIIIPISFTGNTTTISFNYRYLLDGITVLEEDIFLGVNKENNPSLLKNKNENTFFYVLMPIRIS